MLYEVITDRLRRQVVGRARDDVSLGESVRGGELSHQPEVEHLGHVADAGPIAQDDVSRLA